MESFGKIHHFQWENPLFLCSFSIARLNYQRVHASDQTKTCCPHVQHSLGQPAAGWRSSTHQIGEDWSEEFAGFSMRKHCGISWFLPHQSLQLVHGWNNKPTGMGFLVRKIQRLFFMRAIYLAWKPSNKQSKLVLPNIICICIYICIYIYTCSHWIITKEWRKTSSRKLDHTIFLQHPTSQYIEAKRISTHHQVVTCLAAQLLPREDVGAARICHDCRETHPGSCAEQSTQLEVKDLSHHWLPLLIRHIFGAGARHRFVANRICFISQRK